jgi:3-deoxy-manno-octulosonate cytidylyltransferase (CMP-KDO synthetase)
MKAGIVIPARLETQNLPRKVLLDIEGEPLIWRTYQNARDSKGFEHIVVATNSNEVANVVIERGGDVVLTDRDYRTGMESSAVAARILELDVVIHLEADELFIDPVDISTLGQILINDPYAEMTSLKLPLKDIAEYNDPTVVKVVCTGDDVALYFSRAPIPFDGERGGFRGGFRQIGAYGYRSDFLYALVATTASKLEEVEQLEQLRALHMGARIPMVDGHGQPLKVETMDDYLLAQVRWKNSKKRTRVFNQQGVIIRA